MMSSEAEKVFLPILLLLVSAGTICSATEDPEPADLIVQSSESKSNDSGVCNTRTCSKLEYYDKLKQKCRDFPGGGILVIMDHSTKCAHGDSGLHTFSRRDYYYVCNPEGVMIGLCPDKTVFSDTEKRCIMQTNNQPCTIKVHDESQNCNIVVPDCNGVGLFPIPSNCSFYFKCQEHNYDFYQYVYQCPPGKVFHPDLLRCSSSNKCYDGHEDILNNFNKDYFPECHIYGQFRTAKDCTLYYRCVPNMDGSFYQIRYECPYKMYYNIEKEICMNELCYSCDYIPHERIIEDYKLLHSLDGSTLAAQPTTVISAINTSITSNMPAYYDTTQPLNVNDAQSLVQGPSESYTATEPIPNYTANGPEDSSSGPEYGSGNLFHAEPNEASYEEITDSNSGDTPQEEKSGTDIAILNQVSYTTDENLIYEDEYYVPTTEAVEDSRRIIGNEEPFGSSQATAPETRYSGEAYLIPTESTPTEEEYTVGNETNPEELKRRFKAGYDEMVWDSGAWVFPDRKKPTATLENANDCNETGITDVPNDDSKSTNCPDHYSVDFGTNTPRSSPHGGVTCESLSYVSERTNGLLPTDDPYSKETVTYPMGVSTAYSSIESTNDIEPTVASRQDEAESSVINDEPNTFHSTTPLEINCTTDKEGEIVCNGQQLSGKGYLEILGYTLKLRKWREMPDETQTAPGPTINFHFSLQYPLNCVLEAYATDYRTSFSYDYPSPTTVEPTI